MADWGKVDKVMERMVLNEKGELVKIFHVSATTAGGVSFTLDIPAEELEEEAVRTALSTRAAQLDNLLEL